MVGAVIIVAMALAAGACGSPGDSRPPTAPAATPRLVELPVSVFAVNPSAVCAGVALEGAIHLDADLNEVFGRWGEAKVPVTWPKGFRAVFAPGFIEVIDDRGAVFARAGDDINTTESTFHGRRICTGAGIAFW